MESPLISIITPAYNAGRFISTTIQSVINQTYTNWELIIVDDGSTDSTALIVEEFIGKEPRIRYFYQENQRQAAARNRALAEARGELVAFLDHDDVWMPRKLEVCVDAMRCGDADLVFTDIQMFAHDGQLANPAALYTLSCYPAVYKGAEGLYAMLKQNRVYMLTVVARKDAILSVGGFMPVDNVDDYAMWLTLLYEGYTLKGIGEPLSLHRVHPDSASAADRRETRRTLALFRVMDKKYPGVIDYRPIIGEWLGYFAVKVMKKDDMPFLMEQLKHWGMATPRIKRLQVLRPFIPFSSFRRKMRRAFEN